MQWLRHIRQKIRHYLHWQKYQDQKLFYADTVQTPRFWVAMAAGLFISYRIAVIHEIDPLSYWMFPIAIICVSAIFIVLDRILDWICPIG